MSEQSRRTVSILGTRGYPSHYGGFETAVRHLAPYLAARGWGVTVYGSKETPRPGADDSVRSIAVPGIESKSLATLSRGLTSTMHTLLHPPSVALIMNVANGYFLPLFKLRGIPTVVNVDGLEWEREKWGRSARAVFRLGATLTARFADTIVVDSIEIGRRWLKDFNREGTFIPYGGEERIHHTTRTEFPRHNYILYVARLVPENSIGQFLDAARILKGKYPIVVVGSNPHDDEIERQLRDLPPELDVHWIGQVRDDRRLHSLWADSGVYFHGHSVGGTNPALVQAMMLGAPILARDTVYNREVLGRTGKFTDPNPAEVAEALDALMSSPETRARMSRIAVMRANKAYTWDAVCAEYGRTIHEAIAIKQRGATYRRHARQSRMP